MIFGNNTVFFLHWLSGRKPTFLQLLSEETFISWAYLLLRQSYDFILLLAVVFFLLFGLGVVQLDEKEVNSGSHCAANHGSENGDPPPAPSSPARKNTSCTHTKVVYWSLTELTKVCTQSEFTEESEPTLLKNIHSFIYDLPLANCKY